MSLSINNASAWVKQIAASQKIFRQSRNCIIFPLTQFFFKLSVSQIFLFIRAMKALTRFQPSVANYKISEATVLRIISGETGFRDREATIIFYKGRIKGIKPEAHKFNLKSNIDTQSDC